MRIEHGVIDSGPTKPEGIVRGIERVTINEDVSRVELKDESGTAYAEAWEIGTQKIMTPEEYQEYSIEQIKAENALLDEAVVELATMLGGE